MADEIPDTAEVARARPTNEAAQARRQLAFTPNWNWGAPSTSFSMFDLPPRQTLLRDMQRMVRSDETAGAMMYCINTAVPQMGWKHRACVDGIVDEKDEAALEAAHYADSMMHDMASSWATFIKQTTSIVWSGVAPFEIVMKRRDGVNSRHSDGQWGVDRLLLIEPASIMNWVVEPSTNRIIGLKQSTSPAAIQAGGGIPMNKIMHCRTDAYLENPWGEPLLAPAWRAWKLKTQIQDTEATGIQRELVGLPIMRVPQETLDKAAEVDSTGAPTADAIQAQSIIANARKLVSQTRMGPTDGLVIPSDTWAEDNGNNDHTPKYDLKLLTGGGTRSIDTRTPIRDYDRAIARVCLLQFLHLGERSTGSYALSDDQSSMAMKAMGGLAQIPADEWNAKVLPIAWMLTGRDPRYMPRLSPGDVSKEGLTAIGAYLRGVAATEKLWASDEKARISILRSANIEYNRESQGEAAESATEEQQATIDNLNKPTPMPGASGPGPTPGGVRRPANDAQKSLDEGEEEEA